ncbi:ParB/Srx family N-terminal domain-containing protein [Hyalangium minutum]|nr:ParB/Srx family N-terminal domain-containing protein [Hyalangium minutum]
MDAENRVDGEDGMPDAQGESSPAPAQGEGVPSSPEPHTEQSPGQPILLGMGEPVPEAPPASASAAEGEQAQDEEGEGEEGEGEEDETEPSETIPEFTPRLMGEVSLTTLPLDQVLGDSTFRMRPEGEITPLATDIARLGQLFPVDVRPVGEDRYQILCGFRRVAALRFLKRDKVQARVHRGISDEDSLLLALAAAIHASPVDREELEARREQLEAEGRLTAPIRDMLEKALATDDALAPESTEEEVDADELAADAAQRLGALNQDLSLLADVFASLDESRRAELLMQLRYSAELVAYLEGL